MKTILARTLILLCLAALAAGCATKKKMRGPSFAAELARPSAGYDASGTPTYGQAETRDGFSNRMRIWKAAISVEVADVSNAVVQAIALAEQHGGYVESRSDNSYTGTTLKLRLPSPAFSNVLGAAEALGVVMARRVETEDVTEQYVDTEARLKNKLVLRDRLRALLDKATEVKDVLAIETELNRVQGDVDSMEARIRSLQGQVDYATLDLNLKQKEKEPLLGPLGLVCKGLWWTVRKLFVLRD